MDFKKNYFLLILSLAVLPGQIIAQAITLDNLNFYAIQSADGNYWSVRSDGNIESVKENIGNQEIFIFEELDETQFALRAMNNGKYVYCKDAKTTLTPSRDIRNVKETFERTQLDGDLYAIRAHNKMYLRATDGGGGKIKADRSSIGGHERFTFIKLGKFQFTSNNGSFLGVTDGKIAAKSNQTDASTVFTFELENNRAYLKTSDGSYVATTDDGLVAVTNKKDANGLTYSISNTSPFYTINFYDNRRNKVFAVGGGGFAVKIGNPSDAGWADFYLRPVK